jgi:S-adenosylmethionine/arginine decarboxylase-like enzyme
MSKFWGYTLSLDCAGCNPDAIRDYGTVFDFNKALVERIDMVPFGEPMIWDFGHGDKAGFTSVQLISTSSITGHYVNELNQIYLDVFSCKPYEPQVVEDTVFEFFSPTSFKRNFITRQA